MKKIIHIPRTLTKKVEYGPFGCLITRLHHYEYVDSSKNVVIYRCIENGTLECFQKSDFLTNKGRNIDPFEFDPSRKKKSEYNLVHRKKEI